MRNAAVERVKARISIKKRTRRSSDITGGSISNSDSSETEIIHPVPACFRATRGFIGSRPCSAARETFRPRARLGRALSIQLIMAGIENAESPSGFGVRLIRQTSRKVSLSERWLMQFKRRVELPRKFYYRRCYYTGWKRGSVGWGTPVLLFGANTSIRRSSATRQLVIHFSRARAFFRGSATLRRGIIKINGNTSNRNGHVRIPSVSLVLSSVFP